MSRLLKNATLWSSPSLHSPGVDPVNPMRITFQDLLKEKIAGEVAVPHRLDAYYRDRFDWQVLAFPGPGVSFAYGKNGSVDGKSVLLFSPHTFAHRYFLVDTDCKGAYNPQADTLAGSLDGLDRSNIPTRVGIVPVQDGHGDLQDEPYLSDLDVVGVPYSKGRWIRSARGFLEWKRNYDPVIDLGYPILFEGDFARFIVGTGTLYGFSTGEQAFFASRLPADQPVTIRPFDIKSSSKLSVLPRGDVLRGVIKRYFEKLKRFSDPGDDPAGTHPIRYPTNERPSSYAKHTLVDRGNIYIGTGPGLCLAHMAFQNARHGYVIDVTRAVTQGSHPVLGALYISAPTRSRWLSYLFGVPLNDEIHARLIDLDQRELLDFFFDAPRDPVFAKKVRDDLMRLVLPHIEPGMRSSIHQSLWRFLYRYQRRMPLVGEPMEWQLRNLIRAESEVSLLGSEEAYRKGRVIWVEERVTGISADMYGDVLKRLGAELKQSGDRVAVVYFSNIHNYPPREKNGMKIIRERLTHLPRTDDFTALCTDSTGKAHMLKLSTAGTYLPLQDGNPFIVY